MHSNTPTPPEHDDTDSPTVLVAQARSLAPALVSSIDKVARSRLQTVGAQATLVEVAAKLSNAQISLVVVCDEAGQAIGAITETLLIRRLGLGNADFFTTQARDVMTHDITRCTPEDGLSDLLAMMHQSGLIHVLVVDSDNQPIGVVNARDGLRALLAAGNREEELLRNYVMGIGYQ